MKHDPVRVARPDICNGRPGKSYRALLGITALLTGPLLAAAPAEIRAVRAAQWVAPSGELRSDATLLIRAGRIESIGEPPSSAGAVAGPQIDEYPGAVLSPGLIDPLASLSAFGQLRETRSPVSPELIAAEAFDRYSVYLRPALMAGVTTFGLNPDDSNPVAGRLSICQTSGPDGTARALELLGPLKLTLSPAAFLPMREPTSRAGALGLLRATFESAHSGRPDPGMTALVSGRLPGLFIAPSGADVLAALELAEAFGLKLVVAHTEDARDVADEIRTAFDSESRGAVLGIIVGPLTLGSSARSARAASEFERVGLAVALAGGLPETSPDSLRIGAYVAVQAGLSPAAARLAITSRPAEFLGIGDRVGALQAGLAADLVVWSGDPLDLRSRVLAVYIDGVRVYYAPTLVQEGKP